MFENRILFLTIQVLVSFANAQILTNYQVNQQPRSYKNYEQRLHNEGVKQYNGIRQPLTLQTQIQSISAAPKHTVIPNENLSLNKIPPNPTVYNYEHSPNNYENIIRKYDSMSSNPNVVNNYYIIPPENYKRTEFNNRNIKYNDNVNKNKAGKKRRKKENSPTQNEKEKVFQEYRQGDGVKRKNYGHKPQGEITLKNKETKRKHHVMSINEHEDDFNESDEIEKIIREELDKAKNIEKPVKQKDQKTIKDYDKESRNLGEKEKLISFGEIHSTEERNNGYRKNSDEEHRKTRNLKSTPTIEYETKYINPQDEFNKYWQNIMNGNLSYPYYYSNDMFPYNFESMYKTRQIDESVKPNNKNANKRKKSKKLNQNTKRRNKERNKEDECNTVIELTPSYYESTPITISTGKGSPKDIYLNLKIKKNGSPSDAESISKTELHKHDDDYLDSNLKDLDEESTYKPLTITLYEPIEENLEYYPDFTLLNHAYITSSEEEELYNFQNNYNNDHNDWDYYADKVKSYVGQSSKKHSHTKPYTGLENPDFLTSIVNKKDKQSADKPNNNKNIETIYAPSRVLSYNPPEKKSFYDSEEDQSNLWCKEGDTTIVYARSIDQ